MEVHAVGDLLLHLNDLAKDGDHGRVDIILGHGTKEQNCFLQDLLGERMKPNTNFASFARNVWAPQPFNCFGFTGWL